MVTQDLTPLYERQNSRNQNSKNAVSFYWDLFKTVRAILLSSTPRIQADRIKFQGIQQLRQWRSNHLTQSARLHILYHEPRLDRIQVSKDLSLPPDEINYRKLCILHDLLCQIPQRPPVTAYGVLLKIVVRFQRKWFLKVLILYKSLAPYTLRGEIV